MFFFLCLLINLFAYCQWCQHTEITILLITFTLYDFRFLPFSIFSTCPGCSLVSDCIQCNPPASATTPFHATQFCSVSITHCMNITERAHSPPIRLMYFHSNCICEIGWSKFLSVVKRHVMKISGVDKVKLHSFLLSELYGEWKASRFDHLTPGEISPSAGPRAGLDEVAKIEIPAPARDWHTVIRSVGIRLSELPRLVTG
jgi:hypothetical protein